VEAWYSKTGDNIRMVNENVSAHDRAAKKQHLDIIKDIRQVGMDVLEHCENWRSKAEQKSQGEASKMVIYKCFNRSHEK
jgi:CheY-like chemotaxis protein